MEEKDKKEKFQFVKNEFLSKKKKMNFNRIDTTNKTKEDVSLEVANKILDNVRTTYTKRLIKEYKID